jgi:hypothetical protein
MASRKKLREESHKRVWKTQFNNNCQILCEGNQKDLTLFYKLLIVRIKIVMRHHRKFY